MATLATIMLRNQCSPTITSIGMRRLSIQFALLIVIKLCSFKSINLVLKSSKTNLFSLWLISCLGNYGWENLYIKYFEMDTDKIICYDTVLWSKWSLYHYSPTIFACNVETRPTVWTHIQLGFLNCRCWNSIPVHECNCFIGLALWLKFT